MFCFFIVRRTFGVKTSYIALLFNQKKKKKSFCISSSKESLPLSAVDERLVLILLHCDDTHVSGIIFTGEFSFKQCNYPFFQMEINPAARISSLRSLWLFLLLLIIIIIIIIIGFFAFLLQYSVKE